MKITLVAGARPNFVKIAPIINAIKKAQVEDKNIHYYLVHTGQHFDHNMSDIFFKELNIPQPDIVLNCNGDTQAQQTATIMIAFEKVLISHRPDIVLVVGDANSTLACSIVAKKLNIKIAHVEAGIRSFDLSMPEEINRMITDSISDYFFTTSETANENLRKSGVKDEQIFFVGNVMIDTLLLNHNRFIKPEIFTSLGLSEKQYFVLTMHRPSNVDKTGILVTLLKTLAKEVHGLPIVFPIHPRTAQALRNIGSIATNLHISEPLGYLEFNFLVESAKAVITDSGGITEETTVLGVPCITLRENTERPETCKVGTNELIGTNPKNIRPVLNKLFTEGWKKGGIPVLWDGQAANRIVEHLINI